MGNTLKSDSAYPSPMSWFPGRGNDSSRRRDEEEDAADEINGLSLAGHLIYPELLTEILSYVPDGDLVHRARLVCRQWRLVVDEPGLWKRKAQRRGCRLPHTGTRGAGHAWPQHTYRNIAVKNPFGRNLIRNPDGKQGVLVEWQSKHTSRHGWKIEDPPAGADSLETVDELQGRCTSCWATTYYPCEKWQVVDLATEGCSEEMMAALRPDIYISEWFAARFDCGSKYRLRVQLQDGDNKVLDRFKFDHEEPQWTGSRWTKVEHTFKRPPSSVRYVHFFDAGEDTQFWAGHYGSKMTGATVRLVL